LKSESLYTVGGGLKWHCEYGKQWGCTPQKVNSVPPMWSSHSISGYSSKRVKPASQRDVLYTEQHHSSQKAEATQVSTDRWEHNMGPPQTIECYLALRRRKAGPSGSCL
jgi:hypothetical protein